MQSLNPKRPQTVPNDSMNHAMPQIVKNENSTKKKRTNLPKSSMESNKHKQQTNGKQRP